MTSSKHRQSSAGFNSNQLRKLLSGVDPKHIHSREADGRQLSYIEGWYAIAQANEVFGYAGWDRQTVQLDRVLERTRGDTAICGYTAKVRISVRAGTTEVQREGTGWGWASARTAAAAHERALKSAETDATKRALSTFGARFGLTLYDREQTSRAASSRPKFTLFAPDGNSLSGNLSPEGFSSGLRQLIDACREPEQIDNLSRHNATAIADLRALAPALRNNQGTHFADLLLRLLERARRQLSGPFPGAAEIAGNQPTAEIAVLPVAREDFRRPPGTVIWGSGNAGQGLTRNRQDRIASAPAEPNAPKGEHETVTTEAGQVTPSPAIASVSFSVNLESADASVSLSPQSEQEVEKLAPSRIAPGERVDKSVLKIGVTRRCRDKKHLKRVAELPCLICNRQPSHAHHLRFAQPRGLGQKVSDEFVVPLCALHHGDLHRASSEVDWWKKCAVEPLAIAAELWAERT